MVVESEIKGIAKLFENYSEVPTPSEATIIGEDIRECGGRGIKIQFF